MDKDDSWLYYREDVLEKIDVNAVPNNVESVCNALDYKLGQSWEMYVSELPKMPWTTIFLTSVELDGLMVIFRVVSRAIHDGPNALKSKDFSNQQAEMECPEQVVRKDEEAMEIDSVIKDIKKKALFVKVIKWVHDLILSQCVFVFTLVLYHWKNW